MAAMLGFIFLAVNDSHETSVVISEAPATPNVASVAATLPTTPPASSTASIGITSPSRPVSASATHKQNNPVLKPENIAPEQNAAAASTSSTSVATRVASPYSSDPLPFEIIDARARAATVNILCMPKGGTFRPTSGSGVIIDPRGVILTDAHVAQYVMLSQDPRVDLSCAIRTGSPATPQWTAKVLYIPPMWLTAHAQDIRNDRPTGTGEHDYALLLIDKDIAGAAVTGSVPYVPVDTRSNIAFQEDKVLATGYPAEFVGGIFAERGLYAATSITSIGKLYTFQDGSVDLFSIGSIIAAQGGSSGGPVINQWSYVVGIISTTSDGKTTAERDLHANALSYIDTDLKIQSGKNLSETLAADIESQSEQFNKEIAPHIVNQYLEILSR